MIGEISSANDKKNKASQAAQEKWRIAKAKELEMLSQNGRNADAMQAHENEHADASKIACDGNAPNPNPNPNKTTTREPVGFAEFWSAYPKKVGKGAAEKAFKNARINGALPDILSAIKRQSSSEQWRKDGGQFIPNPATWLNQRRWEDGETSTTAQARTLNDFMREMCL
jgi:hypothetical protein